MSATRILVVRNDKLGDFMLAWPALAVLRRSLPQAHIDVLVPEYTRDLAQLCPSTDGVLVDSGATAELTAAMRAGGYDALLTLFSTTRVGWAGMRAGIRYRLAPATKLAQYFYTDRLRQRRSLSEQPEHQYNADLARRYVQSLGKRVLEPLLPYLSFEEPEIAALEQSFRARHAIAAQQLLVFVHAGSGGSASNLALEQYAQLCRALRSARGHVVVLSAGPGERAYVEQLSAALGPDLAHVIHESSAGLVEFAKHLAFASVFIAGSTGTLHIAGALDVPTAAFYPRRRSSTALRWQTLNRPDQRLAYSPAQEVGESDMSTIDVLAAAREIGERFLS